MVFPFTSGVPLSALQRGGGKISDRSVRRLTFTSVALFLLLVVGYVWTEVHPYLSRALSSNGSNDVVPYEQESFSQAVVGRRLNQTRDCSGICHSANVKAMMVRLDNDFLMIQGSNMLEYKDPYDCDDLMLPGDDDDDDEDCILELGAGRRRADRETARATAVSTGQQQCVDNTDKFQRVGSASRCEKVTGRVCVTGGAEPVVSGGALPVVRPQKMVWIVWYIMGIVYMFAALAIVCDEFFVPALECFVDEFGISMDVAGATFMAAGGSMPELFTSFIATFQESEVGFVAIVGSAVFNVLFVIAVCAIASTEVLVLTWWPLARDCSFYVIALVTVALVFTNQPKNEISWPEACILLLEYISYCTFMKFNGRIYNVIEERLSKRSVKPGETVEPKIKVTDRNSVSPNDANTNFSKPSQFRSGIVQMLTKNAYLYETAGIAAVTQIKGELEETFNKLDTDNDGKINSTEVGELLESLGVKPDSMQIKTAIRRINRSGDDEITFENFKKWYLSSEARIEAELHRVFAKLDQNNNGYVESNEIKELLKQMGHKATEDETKKIMEEITSSQTCSMHLGESPPLQPDTEGNRDSVAFVQFEEWYKTSLFFQGKQKQNEMAGQEPDEGLNLELPDGASWSALFWYFFTYPLCALLYCTLPDVRTPKLQRNAKMAILEFSLSLVWIGIFSNWLYECLVVVSNTFKIPVAVSAVTLLAGGTSVPDLLSSYVVAKNGEGDMAVSSSIGSNIFDVTVGLPLPWLSYCIIKGKPFKLGAAGSRGLGFSILLLVGMLAAVIGTIVIMRWRLTKVLGYLMFLFYIIYVVQYLLQKLPAHCNLNETGVFQVDF